MKKKSMLLAGIIILFANCSKSKPDSADTELNSGFIIRVYINKKLTTQEIVSNSASVGAIHVWKADGKDFEIVSSTDAISGYARDKNTSRSIKSDYTTTSNSFAMNAAPGKYFAFVILDDSETGRRFCYSHTPFEVKKGEVTTLEKKFTTKAPNLSFESWNASEN